MALIINILLSSLLFTAVSSRVPEPEYELKLVIDHDGGADDALAITMSLLYEKYFNGPKVVGLTTCRGNVNLTQVIINSARVLDLCDRSDVPIYSGAERGLISEIASDHFFGYDGLGDDGYIPPEPVAIQKVHAVIGLIELSKKYEVHRLPTCVNTGELVIMSIAPATNLALAIRLDPNFIDRLAHLYVGSGHIYMDSVIHLMVRDNPRSKTFAMPGAKPRRCLPFLAHYTVLEISACEKHPNPEFNTKLDPEAYQIVAVSANPEKVTFIPSSQIHASLTISKEWRTDVLGAIDTSIIRALNGYERLDLPTSNDWILLDPAVAAIVLDQSIVDEYKNSSNGVILCGSERGITTNDFTSTDPNTRLVYSASVDGYKKLLIDVYSAELKY